MKTTFYEGRQRITTYYTPVAITPERDLAFNPMQERMDQRPDARGNL